MALALALAMALVKDNISGGLTAPLIMRYLMTKRVEYVLQYKNENGWNDWDFSPRNNYTKKDKINLNKFLLDIRSGDCEIQVIKRTTTTTIIEEVIE